MCPQCCWIWRRGGQKHSHRRPLSTVTDHRRHLEQLELIAAQYPSRERRLLYVAMTRAKNELHLIHPLRFYVHRQHRHGERHVYAPLSRFLPGSIANRFETASHGRGMGTDGDPAAGGAVRVDVAARLREMW